MAINPKVSIILPVYNVEKYIRQTMESVIHQTLADIEIIPVDDGSPDNCGVILDEYAQVDARVKPIHKTNGGYGTAVNAGLAAATGQYVGIVESDDYVDSGMFQFLWEQAQSLSPDVSRCSYRLIERETPTGRVTTLGAGLGPINVTSHPEILVTPPAIWSAIYRRDFLIRNQLKIIDIPGISYQDVDFFVRTTVLAERIVCTDEAFYNYRVDNQFSSSNSTKKIDDIFRCYRLTDEFIAATVERSSAVQANYQKRKVCDFQWHFKRLHRDPSGRRYFAKKAAKYLSATRGAPGLANLLDRRQKFFLNWAMRFPYIYTALRSLERLPESTKPAKGKP